MLCDPVVYCGTQSKLFSFTISSGQVFTFRHFSIDHDLETLIEKLLEQTNRHWDLYGLIEKFKESFTYMAGSHTSQAFIGTIDERQVIELETHKGDSHQPQLTGYDVQPGDFIVQIAAGDWSATNPALYAECLQHCWRYFLKFKEVDQLLLDVNNISQPMIRNILETSGLRRLRNGIYFFN